ncbi:MAG: HEPN domain-containing protein [Nitrospinae bacterium]|nr:HEPN domain-containing protein [Nitrospinota bacterium]
MLKTVKDVTERLIEYYNPDRIILYGSHGTKKSRRDSDVDLFIIKDTDKQPIERRIEVEKLLSDRSLPLDILVYTPQEVRLLFSMGCPLVEEVMENGRLLYMRKVTNIWIKDAEDELDSAIILYEHGKYRGSCYHSQQCVEKGLKALILEKGKRPGKIHDLVELLNKITKMGWDTGLSVDDAVFLNSIYKGRYPTEEGLLPHGEPSYEDAGRAVSAAKAVIREIKKIFFRAQ